MLESASCRSRQWWKDLSRVGGSMGTGECKSFMAFGHSSWRIAKMNIDMVFGEGGTARSDVLFDVKSPTYFKDGQVFYFIFFNSCCTLFIHRLRRSLRRKRDPWYNWCTLPYLFDALKSLIKWESFFDLASLVLRNFSCSERRRLNVGSLMSDNYICWKETCRSVCMDFRVPRFAVLSWDKSIVNLEELPGEKLVRD